MMAISCSFGSFQKYFPSAPPQLAREPITRNAICPGFVLTPLIERQIEAKAQKLGMPREAAICELLKEKQPSMRFTQVEEIGALVVFLCSDVAANITAASLPMEWWLDSAVEHT